MPYGVRVAAVVIIAAVGCVLAPARGRGPSPASDDQVIRVEAQRFEFVPDAITVKKGVPVALEIRATDVPHGFSLPDFGVRAEVHPGEVARVWFTPEKTGSFQFLCDIYCGSGHEDMSGTLVVVE